MKKLAGNEALEVLLASIQGRPQYLHNELQTFDPRGKLMIELVKMWGHLVPLAEAMHDAHSAGENPMEEARERPPGIGQLVLRAAEAVDAIWDEAKTRGWVFDVPTLSELE